MHVMIIIPRYDKIKYIINVLLPASILMSIVPSWLISYIRMLVVRVKLSVCVCVCVASPVHTAKMEVLRYLALLKLKINLTCLVFVIFIYYLSMFDE